MISFFIPRKHPESHFTVGNTETLTKPDIVGRIDSFYRNNYSLDGMKIVTICNSKKNGMKKKDIQKIIEQSTSGGIMPVKRQIERISPEFPTITNEYIAMFQGKNKLSLTIITFVPFSLKLHKDSLEFVTYVLNRMFIQNLNDLNLAKLQNFGTDYGFSSQYTKYFNTLDLFYDGKKNIKLILQIYFTVLRELEENCTEDNFNSVKKEKNNAFRMQGKENQSFKLNEYILEGFQKFGFLNMISHDNLINNFNAKQIKMIIHYFQQKAKFLYILGGKFTSVENSELKLQTNIDDTIANEINEIEGISFSDLINGIIIDDKYLGQIRSKSQVKLNNMIKRYKLKFGFKKFDRNELLTNQIIINKYRSSQYILPEKLLGLMNKSNIDKKIEDFQKVKNIFYQRLNTNYGVPSVSIKVALIPKKLGKHNNFLLKILTELWNFRVSLFNDDIIVCKAKILIEYISNRVIISIDSPVIFIKNILSQFEKLVLKNTMITNNEEKVIYDRIYSNLTSTEKLFQQTFEITTEFLNHHYIPQNSFIKKLRRLKRFDYKEINLGVGLVYIEGNLNDKEFKRMDTQSKLENLLQNYFIILQDQKYHKQLKLLKHISFKKLKNRYLKIKRNGIMDDNRGYTITTYVGSSKENKKGFALNLILASILDRELFEYIRTKLNLGYVAAARCKKVDNEMYIIFLFQTNNLKRLEEEVIKFLTIFETKLINLKEETLKNEIRTQISIYSDNFKSLSVEADLRFKILQKSMKVNYIEQMRDTFETVTRIELIESFRSNFLKSRIKKNQRRIIVE